ncbi:Heparinase II/III-like protein [Marininema mesophilum]|uniref:Heparinase II/III-like protein n=1 Tax=Marininema mesophilum TaxID=1048340 RepID=A0A1H3CVY3_9BACL|nr:heparinase II/III family protein [Marininema mesophilum]SDX58301.1 Heparinase II/III-like protein [Marininema mesophilum]
MKVWMMIYLLLFSLTGTTFLPSLPVSLSKTSTIQPTKTHPTYYTLSKVAHARHNIQRYAWARQIRDNAVHEADHYLHWGMDRLWMMITPQSLPRSFAVNLEKGSPITGKKLNDHYGYRGWLADPKNDPWKLTDPSSGYRFPTNDFASYYQSGLNEYGIFERKRANPQFLRNELYPEKGGHWGVDDGRGWIDKHGDRWTFIAYYNHWHIWHGGVIDTALRAFRDAYLYTGEPRYVDAGIILLDRIADIYPAMDLSAYDPTIYRNSHGGTGQGKIRGSIWEATAVTEYLAAYDAFFPRMNSPITIAFLAKKAAKYHLTNPKNSSAAIRKNIEEGLLRQIFPAMKKAQIRGNFGMHQRALAMAAVVLDDPHTSKRWIDWLFQAGTLYPWPTWRMTGGDVYSTLMDRIDHDGFGDEPSTQYNSYWLTQIMSIADILEGYDRYPEADLYHHLKVKKMFDSRWPLLMENHTPAIGDSFKTGNPVLVGSAEEHVKAFAKYHDPIYAQAAYYLNGNSFKGLHGDIFSAHPEKTIAAIRQVIQTQGPLNPTSVHLSGFGFAALRAGKMNKVKAGIELPFSQLRITEKSGEIIHHQGALYLSTDSLAKHIPEAFHLPEDYYADSKGIQMAINHPGGQVTFSFPVHTTGSVHLDLTLLRATNQGVYDIRIDGHSIHQTDFYSSDPEKTTLPLGNFTLAKGLHTLTFHNIGKNPISTGFGLSLDRLQLRSIPLTHSHFNKRDPHHKQGVWMYYGDNGIGRHGHKDTLNIGIHGFGLDLAPELGYPTDLKTRTEWVANTISHNTVVVDQQQQSDHTTGIPHHFEGRQPIQLIDVDAPFVYPQTQHYRRTVAMIDMDDTHSYIVDFFRVKGGHDHHYSFHGAEGVATTGGLHPQPQPKGTYAGPTIPFGRKESSQSAGWKYTGSGFHYLDQVTRDNQPKLPFFVDWKIKDTWKVTTNKEGHHLRLTMLTPVDDVALANGYPPHLPGNPDHLRYLIAHRKGNDLASQFVSVMEPYRSTSHIRTIKPLPLRKIGSKTKGSHTAFALQVELTDGRVDTIFNSLDPQSEYKTGPFTFRGFFGCVSTRKNLPIYAHIHDGTLIQWKDKPLLHIEHPSLKGTILDFTRSLSSPNEITIKTNQPLPHSSTLIGRFIYIKNKSKQNVAYRIYGVKVRHPHQYTLDIGDNTLIRRYEDPSDFGKGLVYDIHLGDKWRIPHTQEWIKDGTTFKFLPSQIEDPIN